MMILISQMNKLAIYMIQNKTALRIFYRITDDIVWPEV